MIIDGSHAKRVLLGLGITMITAAVLLCSSCGNKEPEKKESVESRPVKTMILDASASGAQRSFPGKVQASQEVDLSFEVSGRLNELPIREGQTIAKDDLLARLDPRDFQNDLAKQKAKFDNAKVNFERAERLVASGAISQQEFDSRKALYEMAAAEFKTAEKALQDSYLKAPFAGLIAKKYVDNHEYVKAKQRIVSLQDVSHIEIVVNVPEDIVAWTRSGKNVTMSAKFEAVPNQKFNVTVKEYGTQANKQTQTFPVTLTMPSPENVRILPGMTATVTVQGLRSSSATEGHYVIPVSAVLADDAGKSFVWTVDRKGMTASKKEVKVGDLTGESIRVLEGLKPGDMIITAGVDYVRHGMKVRPLDSKTGGKK
jgi:multidrug efflux system membrane fusion protein